MTIKTVVAPQLAGGRGPDARHLVRAASTDAERIRAAVSWVLAHPEITGLATPGDVRLLEHDRSRPSATG